MHEPATDDEQAAEEQRLHHERWQRGGKPPSDTLRALRESNVLSLLAFDNDLEHALDAAGTDVQPSVALLAAHRACQTAGLTTVPWVATALTTLTEGHPLPPPFDDTARMRETLRSTPLAPGPPVQGATPPERPPYIPPTPAGRARIPTSQPTDDGAKHYELRRPTESPPPAVTDDKFSAAHADASRAPVLTGPTALTHHPARTPQVRGPISQPHFALPAIQAAADPSPLKAALDAVSHAPETHEEHHPQFLKEIRSHRPDRPDKETDPSPRKP